MRREDRRGEGRGGEETRRIGKGSDGAERRSEERQVDGEQMEAVESHEEDGNGKERGSEGGGRGNHCHITNTPQTTLGLWRGSPKAKVPPNNPSRRELLP